MAKKVIRQILVIYLTTTGVFLTIFFTLWYQKLNEELILLKGISLRENHRNIVLSIINSRFTPIKVSAKNIAQSTALKFAIFDTNETLFNNLDFDFRKAKTDLEGKGIYDDKVFFLAPMSTDYYFLRHIGNEEANTHESLQILIQGEDVSKSLFWIRVKVFGFAIMAFCVLGLVAYVLVKIALKPLEDKISTLDRFIKDSMHELNTPLSVILASIEQLKCQNWENEAKFKRITLAAKSLSQVYSDLVFYNFPNALENTKQQLDLKLLLEERLEYFKVFFEQKKITLKLDLHQASIFASKNQISKLIDNLLSNAIKYNKKGGEIAICLRINFLSIADTGYGIAKKNLEHIFDRYARFNADKGGFGIGLSLVKRVCEDNAIKIICNSVENKGSVFKLSW
ncbi:HAMP domain-containing histidine kinase [Campylobacter sp. VicNov18]|uniref:two-component system sensor histidine kinase DccS n=1 Tax=Campylobacter bilis TaxID=2691918 RepID=UPI00130EB043|nr:HAMP domain-containing sensor histidine kinase [Campylobacter bilis]MPV63155.1 sensor histidine kinase [Campylobacter hepaticus]MBM0636655.1 sensor histidine kinase [Campylobacter bilis]MCC8277499.1 HAMP domain-containing histidine kinase [Campylobacter bilis]MCC8298704.1 HAMP domain-containing histidine kinase [Campylobacter bilis]MCC8300408.1 HAMP domain-containing histidine kinase [Campylobacter bilis]